MKKANIEAVDIEDPEPPAQGLTLVNMKEAFYMTKRELLQNTDGVAR